MPDDEDGAGGAFDHPLGYATDVDALCSVAACSANGNQIYPQLAGQIGNLSVWNAVSNYLLDV